MRPVGVAPCLRVHIIVLGTHGRSGFERILCPVDFSEASLRALEYGPRTG